MILKSLPNTLSKLFILNTLTKWRLAILLFGCLILISNVSFSQSIFTNPITGTNPSSANPYTAGQVLDANLDAANTNIGYGSGLTSQATNDRYNLKAWPTADLAANDYIEFKLTPSSTFEINFTSLVYTGSVSTNGPSSLVLRSSVDNFTNDISTLNPTGATISLTDAAFQNINTEIIFRIYGFYATSATGTYSINNFTFNGTVIPAIPILPVITSSLTALNGVVNNPMSVFPANIYTIMANNFPTGFNATGLPPGLNINSSTGAITGVPTTFGTYNVSISASNAAGTDTKILQIIIGVEGCNTVTNNTVYWNFDNGDANLFSTSPNPILNLPNNSISAITLGNGHSTNAAFNAPSLSTTSPSNTYSGFSANNNIMASCKLGVLDINTSTYFQFTLTPVAGFNSRLSGIEFGYRSTGTGPANYSLRSSADNYASDISTGSLNVTGTATWSKITVPSFGTLPTEANPVTYRIYGFGGTGTPPPVGTPSANWRVDDVKITLDVITTAPIKYTVTSSATSYCAGGTGVNVGLSNSQIGINYQLVLNGTTNIGTPIAGTGSSINFGLQTAAGNYSVDAYRNATNCFSDMLNNVTITIDPVNTWTGSLSTAWETPGNWACGTVPNASTTQINIPSAPANQPVLNSNVLISGILNLQNTGSTLSINGNTLTLNNTIIGSGSLIGSATSNLVVDNETGAAFNLNFNQTSASNRTLNNYTQNRNATVTLSSPLWINGVVNNTSNTGVLASGTGAGNLTLLCTASKVSGIAYLNAGADVSGNINVQSYFTGGPQATKRGTRMIAFPVRDNQASPKYIFEQIKSQMFFTGPGNTANNFDLGGADRPNATTMVTQDEYKPQAVYAFTPIGNLLTRTIPATAYFFFYRGDRTTNVFNKLNQPFADPENVTVTYNGPINKGNIDIGVTNTANVGDNYNGICAIGNPYPSIIDFDAFLADNTSRLEDIISIIKPDRTGQITKVGNVSTNNNFNEPNGSIFNNPSTGIRYVQPCQSFYVKVKPGQSGLVSFNELHKTSSITTPARLLGRPSSPILSPRLMVKKQLSVQPETQQVLMIAISDNTINNETAIIFKNGYLATYEGADAPLLTTPLLNCATLSSDGVAMAINLMPDVTDVSTVKLLVNSETSQQNLKLNFKGLSHFSNQNMVLKDKYLNKSQPLDNVTSNYVFGIDKTVAASFGSERFELQISPKAVLALHITKFEVVGKNNTALLKWEVSSNKEIQKFEIEKSDDGINFSKTGETFTHTNTQNNSYTFVDNYPYPITYYKIKQVNTTGSDYSPIAVLNNSIKNPNTDYQIYPTNVSDKLNINCKSNLPIMLNIQIISLNGNIIHTYQASQASTLQVSTQQLKAGMYIVKISNAETKENLYISKITKR